MDLIVGISAIKAYILGLHTLKRNGNQGNIERKVMDRSCIVAADVTKFSSSGCFQSSSVFASTIESFLRLYQCWATAELFWAVLTTSTFWYKVTEYMLCRI
jgi:hypothetical protein